ncbi:hypothetical protein O181_130632 [Austropuccinia psidii MF-1]|uniref:Uncharacterized protein n=1 Tax=Austropuccinia psidii MF-1 TaxID=1389203 RepID=A0A9Q3QCN2_9BASI|nr:hypothetical protein [Austropuccinia psidii MF-1]
MNPVLKVAEVVHIWYHIPLCTIFAQQFNGNVVSTQFHLSKSRSQNSIPISKEDFLTHQSGNPWRQSEDHSGIPITWPCRSWVGYFIQDYSKGHSQSLYILSISFQGIKYFNTPWTTQFGHTGVNQPVCTWPNWANSYSTLGIQSHSSNFKIPRFLLTQFRQ